MGLKVTLCKMTFTDVETEIPDECPGCGADLTVDGAELLEQQLIASEQECMREGDLVEEYGSSKDFPETNYVTGYRCHCGQMLVTVE